MSSERERMTKAQYARHFARILRIAATEMSALAGGMWNPLFCEDAADLTALDEIQEQIDWIRELAKSPPHTTRER